MESTPDTLTDTEIIARLQHEAAQWFNNTTILLLEELIRRYKHAIAKQTPEQ